MTFSRTSNWLMKKSKGKLKNFSKQIKMKIQHTTNLLNIAKAVPKGSTYNNCLY
jgi:hypothetical protein